jgi:hypothetical protein
MPGPIVNVTPAPIDPPDIVHGVARVTNPDLLLDMVQLVSLDENPLPVTVTTVATGPLGGDNEIERAYAGKMDMDANTADMRSSTTSTSLERGVLNSKHTTLMRLAVSDDIYACLTRYGQNLTNTRQDLLDFASFHASGA